MIMKVGQSSTDIRGAAKAADRERAMASDQRALRATRDFQPSRSPRSPSLEIGALLAKFGGMILSSIFGATEGVGADDVPKRTKAE